MQGEKRLGPLFTLHFSFVKGIRGSFPRVRACRAKHAKDAKTVRRDSRSVDKTFGKISDSRGVFE